MEDLFLLCHAVQAVSISAEVHLLAAAPGQVVARVVVGGIELARSRPAPVDDAVRQVLAKMRAISTQILTLRAEKETSL